MRGNIRIVLRPGFSRIGSRFHFNAQKLSLDEQNSLKNKSQMFEKWPKSHTTCVYDVFLISTAHMNQGTEVERLSENVPRRKMFIVSSRISPRSHVSKRFLTAALSPSYANSLNKTNARIKFSNSNLFVSAESIFYSAPSSK